MKPTIGNTFKQVRLNKGLSQHYICTNIVSRTTLSRFENDKIMVSIKNFQQLLEKIDLSYDEFSFILNNYQLSRKNQAIESFFSLKSNLDTSMIKQIIADSKDILKEEDNWYIESIVKIMKSLLEIDQHSPDEISTSLQKTVAPIWEKLSNQDEWYIIDFRIIIQILFFFPKDTGIKIGEELLSRIDKYKDFSNISPVKISILLNMALLCLQDKQNKKSAYYSQDALILARQLKRYDFLMISLVRHGIATGKTDEIEQGLALADIVDEDNLKINLLNEINFFE